MNSQYFTENLGVIQTNLFYFPREPEPILKFVSIDWYGLNRSCKTGFPFKEYAQAMIFFKLLYKRNDIMIDKSTFKV